jgi:tRNA(adenine34) deaminase
MCAGAIVLARLDRVVYATPDAKAGAAGSVLDILGDRRLNHRPAVETGPLGQESAELLQRFFADRRHGPAAASSRSRGESATG